jgi:hypothetical protein
MADAVHRNAGFASFADEHTQIPLAFAGGWYIERVDFRVSFATDSFDNANFRNWRVARVGWGVWLGPSSAPALNWSTDRSDAGWVWWQASPWIPDYETVVTGGVATPANSYRAGMYEVMHSVPVYRQAAGGEYQLRIIDVDSELSTFPSYSSAYEVAAHVSFP